MRTISTRNEPSNFAPDATRGQPWFLLMRDVDTIPQSSDRLANLALGSKLMGQISLVPEAIPFDRYAANGFSPPACRAAFWPAVA